MPKFIYVFDEDSKTKLVEAGYNLLIENGEKSVYVFVMNDGISFSFSNIDCVFSNTLTY